MKEPLASLPHCFYFWLLTIDGNELCSFRMTLTVYIITYSIQGPTQEVRGREIVCTCTLADSSGASEVYPGWNLLVCSPFILRIQKARLLTLITENLIFLHWTETLEGFCKAADGLTWPGKADTSWSVSQINDPQSRNKTYSQ